MLEEETRVRALERDSRSRADKDAVHVLDLCKTYPGQPAKHAGVCVCVCVSLRMVVSVSVYAHAYAHTSSARIDF